MLLSTTQKSFGEVNTRRRGSLVCLSLIFTIAVLLTKPEVKIPGIGQVHCFESSWTKRESRSINSQKKNEANIQPS